MGALAARLEARTPAVDLRKISIGATNSVLAACRTMFQVDVQEGDVVLWEYALNDSNYVTNDRKAHDPELLLDYCEWLIRHCHARGARFAPLVFTPRQNETQDTLDPYRAALHALLRHYGLPFVDISQEYRARHGVPHLPAEAFENRSHYALDHPILAFIAERAEALLDAAVVPPDVPPLRCAAGSRLVFHTDFRNARKQTFANSALSVTFSEPEGDTVELAPFDRPGRVIGLLLVTTRQGGVMHVALGDIAFEMSAGYRSRDFTKKMVKLFCLAAAASEPLGYRPGDVLRVGWSDNPGPFLLDYGFRGRVPAKAIRAREARIVGVLCQEWDIPPT